VYDGTVNTGDVVKFELGHGKFITVVERIVHAETGGTTVDPILGRSESFAAGDDDELQDVTDTAANRVANATRLIHNLKGSTALYMLPGISGNGNCYVEVTVILGAAP
jgi:hypothetical protein